jgi:hypothetical protein
MEGLLRRREEYLKELAHQRQKRIADIEETINDTKDKVNLPVCQKAHEDHFVKYGYWSRSLMECSAPIQGHEVWSPKEFQQEHEWPTPFQGIRNDAIKSFEAKNPEWEVCGNRLFATRRVFPQYQK